MAAHGSLLGWANTVRLTMATDPGRQLFQEQVQTHGFLFLDDYLDNIMSGAKQDPLIELVKTPGRKKAIARKPTLNSKLANVVTLSLEDDDSKENIAPINNFHKALLDVKPPPTTYPASSQPASAISKHEYMPRGDASHHSDSHSFMSQNSVVANVPPTRPSANERAQQETQVEAESLATPAHQEQNELSVIAEDDESVERSRASIQFGRGDLSSRDLPPLPDQQQTPEIVPTESPTLLMPVDDYDLREEALHRRAASSSSADSFHSIPVNSPLQKGSSDSSHRVTVSPPVTRPSSIAPQHQHTSHSHTAPLPQTQPLQEQLLLHDDAMTAPLPVSSEHFSMTTTYDMEVPLRDPEEATTANYGNAYKANVPSFPTLPEPMPLRKSMKAHRDPSTGAVLLGAATPGAPVGGKRTSWLMKAREVKAMEGAGRKHITPGNPAYMSLQTPGSSIQETLKRKSGDLVSLHGMTGLEDEERKYKTAKNLDSDVAPLKSKPAGIGKGKESEDGPVSECSTDRQLAPLPSMDVLQPLSTQDGVLDRLRKTVEGLGARVGQSMGKSIGGNAAGGLAEARAAAEARVAERNQKEDEMTMAMGKPLAPHVKQVTSSMESSSALPTDATPASEFASNDDQERRLSISDLFPSEGKVKGKHKAPEKVFQFPSSSVQTFAEITRQENASRESTSTTPPHSPPHAQTSNFIIPTGPVFNKPPPVFVPPTAPVSSKPPKASAKDQSFNLPPATTFSMPASMSLGMSPRLPSPTSSSSKVPALSAQSTLESVRSDKVFDDHENAPAWMPSTQETEYSMGYGSQSQPSQDHQMALVDEDDSWPIDEKLAAGVQWTFGKEESMTWSTLPSQSQRADTGPMAKEQTQASPIRENDESVAIPGAFDTDMEQELDELDELDACDSDLEDIVRGAGKSTVSLVEPKTNRSASAMSMASSASSQSQVGFLGQASKFLSSALGTSKKSKPEVKKVLQMAAVAAKKQQEEADKKAARLKEMENRRLLAQQRKAEEEKTRAVEQERKLKEEGERRKREREETTDKRPLKTTAGSKKQQEEDTTKRRKVETEKKPEIKKPTQTLNTKPSIIKSSLKQPTALASSTAYNSSLQMIAATSNTKSGDASKSLKAPASLKNKGKAPSAKPPAEEDDISQPSQVLQTQMAARAKAQIQAAKQAAEPVVASESIELPDINSEYSDSEDEDRPNKYDPPDWAQSPELRQALQIQSTINPDDIFGAVRPLKMEELFKTRTSRFRARTSSANWTGTDRLTLEEEREYARRMGFR